MSRHLHHVGVKRHMPDTMACVDESVAAASSIPAAAATRAAIAAIPAAVASRSPAAAVSTADAWGPVLQQPVRRLQRCT